jgi:hypothetical protein
MIVLSKKEQYTLEIATAIINNFQHTNSDLINWMDSVDWEEFFSRVESITSRLLHGINRDLPTLEIVEAAKKSFETELARISNIGTIKLYDDTLIDVDKDGCIKSKK